MFTVPEDQLPYDPHDEASVLAHARRLRGRTVRDVAEELAYQPVLKDADAGKGKVGGLIEAWFRLRPNQRQEPDLPGGVELKGLPIKSLKKGDLNVKERTIISMIDYCALADEDWDTASVRPKLARILFVPYLHDYDDAGATTFQEAFLWSPPPADDPQFRQDWERIWNEVVEGRAHTLSEGLGRYLGPAVKGSRDPKHRRQPASDIDAKPRAWALKASYTWAQLRKLVDPTSIRPASQALISEEPLLAESDDALWKKHGLTRLDAVERAVLRRLHRYEGRTIADVCNELGIPVKGGDKSLAARLVSAIIFGTSQADAEELVAAGITIKSVHCRAPGTSKRGQDLLPFESMSFPTIDLFDLVKQDWDSGTAEWPQILERLLIIPTMSGARDTPQGERRMGRAFFWSPTPSQWDIIEQDWKEIRDLVADGGAVYHNKTGPDGTPLIVRSTNRDITARANRMPGNRRDHIVHMRPHAADRDDEYDCPGGRTTKQALWLNSWHIYELIVASLGEHPEIHGVTV